MKVWLDFADLKEMGVVDSWQTLRTWQRDPKIGFPPGRLFGPNSRRWDREKEINPWLETRPIVREAFEAPPPRKSARKPKAM
jgi:hypothetical protein